MNPEISKYMSKLGKKSAAKLTAKQRKERATKAINARWDKQRKEDEDNATE